MKMIPLRVSCTLMDGNIVSTDGIFPLDAILAAAWMQLNYPDQYYNDSAKVELIKPELPLKKVWFGSEWVWAASVAQYKLQGEYIHYWHKRLDEYIVTEFWDRPRRVNVKSGQFKSYRMPLNVLLVKDLTWYCVGDPEAVAALLRMVKSLGKKRSQGFGMVALRSDGLPDWRVEQWPEDWSIWGPNGRLMRMIPFAGKLVPGATIRRWGIRPPGWHRENQVLALIPEVGDWK